MADKVVGESFGGPRTDDNFETISLGRFGRFLDYRARVHGDMNSKLSLNLLERGFVPRARIHYIPRFHGKGPLIGQLKDYEIYNAVVDWEGFQTIDRCLFPAISSEKVSAVISDRFFQAYRDEVLALESEAEGIHALASLFGPGTSQLLRNGATEDRSISRYFLDELETKSGMQVGSNILQTRRVLFLPFDVLGGQKLLPSVGDAPADIRDYVTPRAPVFGAQAEVKPEETSIRVAGHFQKVGGYSGGWHFEKTQRKSWGTVKVNSSDPSKGKDGKSD